MASPAAMANCVASSGANYTCSGVSSAQTITMSDGNVTLDNTYTTSGNDLWIKNTAGNITFTQESGSRVIGSGLSNTYAVLLDLTAENAVNTINVNGEIASNNIAFGIQSSSVTDYTTTLTIGPEALLTSKGEVVDIALQFGTSTLITYFNGGHLKTEGMRAFLSSGSTDKFYMQSGLIEGNVAIGDQDDLLIASGGKIKGTIYMGNQDDHLILSGTFDTSELVRASGFNDTDILTIRDIQMNGYSAALDTPSLGTNIDAFEVVNLENNAKLNLKGGLFLNSATGVLNITSNATLDTSSSSNGAITVFGDVNNNHGIISLKDNKTDDATTITGNYAGTDGTLVLDTVLDGDNSSTDRLIVNGNVSGTTGIIINPSGGGLVKTTKGIAVVEVKGTSTANAFTLKNDVPLEMGVYVYGLTYYGGADQNWYLTNKLKPDTHEPVIGTIGAVYESASGLALNDLFVMMPTLEQRVGQRQWLSYKANGDDHLSSGFWMRGIGDYERATPHKSDAELKTRSWRFGAQAGFDLVAAQNSHGAFVAGVTGQYLHSQSHVDNEVGRGHVENDIYGGGITATWYGTNGFYADGQAQLNHLRQTYKSNNYGSLKKHQGRTGYALSQELGYRFDVTETMRLVPQAQFMWGNVDDVSFDDEMNNEVKLHHARGGRGRVGLAYEYEFSAPMLNHQFGDYRKAYLISNILHNFNSHSRAEVSGDGVAESGKRSWAEVGLGGTLGRNQSEAVFVEAHYRTKLSGHGKNHAFGGTAGFRFSW